MDKALGKLREGFVFGTSGDPLAALADDLGVAAAKFERLDQGEQSLDSVYQSKYICLIELLTSHTSGFSVFCSNR